MKRYYFSLVIIPFLFEGCLSLTPDYNRIDAPIPKKFEINNETQKTVLELKWKDFIKDERLRNVILMSLENNRTLRKSILDIEAARATYRIQKSSEFPSIEASATGSKVRSSGSNITQSSSLTLGINSYELDFFGKVKNMSDMEFETYLGVEEATRSVQITLISETAIAWFTMASDQAQLALAIQTKESAKRSLDIIQKRLELGVDSSVNLYDARILYEEARTNVANYMTKVGQDKAALELLVGKTIPEILLPTSLDDGAQEWLMDVPVGISSDILLQRPDVLEAEHNLKSANANIGVARAAYFPSISLTTKGGLGSSNLSGLFTGSTGSIWSFAPTISLPIFDAEERDATLEYAKVKRDSSLATYELTIQTAFKEVASALARHQTIVEQLDAQKALVMASYQSALLYDARYKKGVDTYLNVLLTQRSFYSTQQNKISLLLEELSNRVTLYQVLGGGLN